MPLKAQAIEKVTELLKGYKNPWWVAGGWAVDMHLGYQSRPHTDLEIAISRDDQHRMRQFLGTETIWEYILKGERHVWKESLNLSPPIHEVWVTIKDYGRLEILLNDFDADFWIYRRDARIRLDRHAFAMVPPTPLPRAVLLLYKSTHRRPKDIADFNRLYPALPDSEKTWLRAALKITGSPSLTDILSGGAH